MNDYIPKKDSELLLWGTNFTGIVAAYAGKWTIDTGTVTDLQDAMTAYDMNLKIADGPNRNKVNVERKNVSRAVFVSKVRALVNYQLKNPVISDADRLMLGLRIHDKTPSTLPVPTEIPALGIEVHNPRQLSIVFRNADSESKAKPYGVNGAVIVYGLPDTPPAKQSDLPRNVLATRTPHILEFEETERGRTVYIAICWQNEKGQKGPWSDMEQAIVP